MSLKVTAPVSVLGVVSLKAFNDLAKTVTKVEEVIKFTGGGRSASQVPGDDIQRQRFPENIQIALSGQLTAKGRELTFSEKRILKLVCWADRYD